MKQIMLQLLLFGTIIFALFSCKESPTNVLKESADIFISPVFVNNQDTVDISFKNSLPIDKPYKIYIDDIEPVIVRKTKSMDMAYIKIIIPDKARTGMLKIVWQDTTVIAPEKFKIIHVENIWSDSANSSSLKISGWGFMHLVSPLVYFGISPIKILENSDTLMVVQKPSELKNQDSIFIKSGEYIISKKVTISPINWYEISINYGNITMNLYRTTHSMYYPFQNETLLKYDTVAYGYSIDSKTFGLVPLPRTDDVPIVFDKHEINYYSIVKLWVGSESLNIYVNITKVISYSNGSNEFFKWSFDCSNIPYTISGRLLTANITGSLLIYNMKNLNYYYYNKHETSPIHYTETETTTKNFQIESKSYLTIKMKY